MWKLLAALLVLVQVHAIELTVDNFDETVVNSDSVWMIEFSSEMCKFIVVYP
jgi:hypothetical protein